MYLISNAIYDKVAQQLIDEMENLGYFAGSIDLDITDDDGCEIELHLITSLYIYHSNYSAPEGDVERISKIVPVWCECNTIVDGEVRISNFDMGEVINLVCGWDQ